MKRLYLISFIFFVPRVWAQNDPAPNPLVPQQIGPFSGLNNQDNSVVIPNANAQDLLNVDITPGGRSIKRRHGYGLDAQMFISTAPIHGGYHFYDSSGNDIRLWANDVYVNASVNGAAYTTVVTSITKNATLSCTDSQGLAWCVTTGRDQLFSTNGKTVTFYPSAPQGTEITASPGRLVIANTVANPSLLNFSQQGDFTTWTTGINTSSAFTENILGPGSHITHIRYANGRYLWWKDQSFGYLLGDDQFSISPLIVSYLVGTLDNSSVENEGVVYFRGQDNHIWAYDGSQVTRLTREITPLVNADNVRKSNFWTQTSQADFNAGIISTSPVSYVSSNTLSTTISPGDVIVSSFTTGSINQLVSAWTYNGTTQLANNSFESGQATNWTATGGWSNVTTDVGGVSMSPQDGSFFEKTVAGCGSTLNNNTIQAIKCSDSSVLASTSPFIPIGGCLGAWTRFAISGAGLTGLCIKVQITDGVGNVLTSDPFISDGNDIQFWMGCTAHTPAGPSCDFDNFTNSPKNQNAVYTSPVYNNGFTTSTIQLQTFFNTTSTPTYSLQTSSASTGPWAVLFTSTGTNKVGNQYVMYSATYVYVGADPTLITASVDTILARSTGTYYSAVNNAPNITQWDIFGGHDLTPGISTITYFVRASTGSFAVSASTPAWTIQQKNATVNYSTGTYMQMRADFNLTAATETPTINDFTFNWFEGNAADKAYATYFDFGIWWSVSYSTAATTNNRILRLDLLNGTWTVYDIKSNGFMVQNNKLYFGDPTTGNTYVFGGVEDDNGAAINAYWKSKDFSSVGSDFFRGYQPNDTAFNRKDYQTLSTFAANQSSGTLTVTYTTDKTTSGNYTVQLVEPNGLGIIRHNYALPFGTKGQVIDIQYGNNAVDQPWEVFGGILGYVPGSWYVYP